MVQVVIKFITCFGQNFWFWIFELSSTLLKRSKVTLTNIKVPRPFESELDYYDYFFFSFMDSDLYSWFWLAVAVAFVCREMMSTSSLNILGTSINLPYISFSYALYFFLDGNLQFSSVYKYLDLISLITIDNNQLNSM